jgi:hypothetical protein
LGVELGYDAGYEIKGDTVVVSHEGDANTYRWAVGGERLDLTRLDTKYGRRLSHRRQ